MPLVLPDARISGERRVSRVRRLLDWLAVAGPTGESAATPDEVAAFDVHRLAFSVRVWARLGLLLAAAAAIWWPLDLVVLADDPHVRRTFAVFRVGIIVTTVALSLVGPRLVSLYRFAVPLLGLTIAAEVGWAGACMGVASRGDPSWFGFFYLAPLFTVPLLAPLRQRVVVAAGVSTVAWGAFHLAVPSLAPITVATATSASQLVFATLIAIALGHWVYEALENQFMLRGRLESKRVVLQELAATLEARVAAQGADLLALSQQAQRARVEERRRIGRDLHDDLGQELTALALLVENLADDGADAVPPLRAVVTRARESLSRLLDGVRPRLLDELGFEDAARELLRERCEASGLRWSVRVHHVSRSVGRSQALTLFRVLQEALHNVVRHAEASEVRLAVLQEADMLVLELADDGVGVRLGAHAGRGLSIIRERCAELGGDAVWSSPNGHGTTLRARLPLGREP